MPDARVIRWDDLAPDHPMPRIQRRRIIGEHAMISRVTLEPGFTLPSHSHANEQFVCLISGRATFVLHQGQPAQREVTLAAGEVLHLPPWAPHSCTAHQRTEIWDIFSPPSATTGVDRPQAP
jgi:quercetin dioxygenase-like cupin family protein